MILIAFRLKTIPRQFKFDLDFGYKLALTYVKQILSVLKEMINHASETSCQIQEQRGFLKTKVRMQERNLYLQQMP